MYGVRVLSNKPSHLWGPVPLSQFQPADWIGLSAIVAIAIALRALFHTGFFGSDEVTYIETAARIASGDWRASNYVGATRYGMNLPLALSIYLFGLSEASANLWPLLCSAGEVAVIFTVSRWLWSTRIAIISAGLLAFLPLHVHIAGRMLADPPLAFFLSLSVALLLHSAYSRHPLSYFAAGLAWGGVFWVKESVGLLYLPVFLFLFIYLNGLKGRWLALFGGIALSGIASCALMNYVAGNPLHIFAVIGRSLGGYSAIVVDTSPWFYLRYLFIDIRHTFLLGYLAAAGVFLYAMHLIGRQKTERGTQFVVLWVLLLLGIFSFAIVSFSPVKLVMKQHNYMLIFVGPMSVLSGWFLASLPQRMFAAAAALIVTGTVVLSALEQQAINVFTANSKAAYRYLRDHPDTYLVGTANNERAINYFSMMEQYPEIRRRISSFGEAGSPDNANSLARLVPKTEAHAVVAVLDLQTIHWHSSSGVVRRVADVPPCWVPMGALMPASLGSGQWIAKGIVAATAALPVSLQQRLKSILQPVSVPAPAYLFSIDRECLLKPLS
jgi:4-amino-4-deoxy-L-arabinose transferase-like glycosyltransferase